MEWAGSGLISCTDWSDQKTPRISGNDCLDVALKLRLKWIKWLPLWKYEKLLFYTKENIQHGSYVVDCFEWYTVKKKHKNTNKKKLCAFIVFFIIYCRKFLIMMHRCRNKFQLMISLNYFFWNYFLHFLFIESINKYKTSVLKKQITNRYVSPEHSQL